MKRRFSNTVIPIVSFLAAIVLCYASGPIRQAIGRQAANCTGFPSCNASFNGQPNVTVTAFAFSFTPINFNATLSGTPNSNAAAHGKVKIYTRYDYAYANPALDNFVQQNVNLKCNDVNQGVVCGTFGYTFQQLDCDLNTLLKRAKAKAPDPNPPGAQTVTVSFVGCKKFSWTMLGDCNGTSFSNSLSGSFKLNNTGSGNSGGPPAVCK